MNRSVSGIAALTLAALTMVSAPAFAQDTEAQTLAGAISAGKATVGFRYRYEYVGDDNPGLVEDTANASTVRLRMNYKTAPYRKFTAFGEFDYIGELLLKDFNSLGGSSPPRNDYPVVADPKGPDLNQLYLDYDPSADTKIRAGRQRILLDNQRFVGGVGWRQNEQTYDGASLSMNAGGNTEFKYAYVTAVRRIFGNDVPAGRHDVDAHLLNAKVKLGDDWAVTPYYYYIDNEDAAGASTGTFGIRATGNVAVGENKLALVGEFANQTDVANNPVSYDASYFHLAANYALKNGLLFGLAYESLGGDQLVGGSSFRTPLATLHAFQGWADKFLNTPDAGINDLFLTVKGKAGKWDLTGVYHDFSAEDGSADWGSEIDMSAGRKLNDQYGILFKAAFYDADLHAADTTKFWIMVTGNY
jgi:hypothetical protein